MKIKNGFELRDVCGENIIIAHGVENIDFTKVITLNESAAYLWKKVEGRDFTESELVDALLDEYEVERPQAEADVKALVASWQNAGLVEA
ncbi:MAG: PqqD family protein [Bacteroidaceae bacterium]|nr:PqqD family protein [Bacteroidaceae bacterium]